MRHLFVLILLLALLPSISRSQQKRSTSKPSSERAVATVNGREIPFSRYEELLRDHLNAQRQAGKPEEIDQATDDQYFLQLIDNELIRQEAEKRGVAVSYKEASDTMLADPPPFIRQVFVDSTGTFHRDLFRQVVLDPRKILQLVGGGADKNEIVKSWKSDLDKVVRYVQADLNRRRLSDAIYAEKPLTSRAIMNHYIAERTLLNGSFIRVLYSTVPDSTVDVSTEEARTYYQKHRDEFNFPPARSVGTLILPVQPLAADSLLRDRLIDSVRHTVLGTPRSARSTLVRKIQTALPPDRFPDDPVSLAQVPVEYIDSLKSSTPGDMVGPFYRNGEAILLFVEAIRPVLDTVLHARHILIKIDGRDTAGEQKAFDLARTLKERIHNDSEFVVGASYFSQDPSSRIGGDLGYFNRGKMIREFDSAAFLGDTGEVIGPVRSPFGYHLIRILEKITQGYVVRELRFDLEPSTEAREQAMADAQRYADALRSDGSTDSLLAELRGRYPGLVTDTSTIQRLQPYGDVLVTGEFAFNAKVGDVGVFTLPFGRIAVLQVQGERPAGIPPFEKFPNYVTALARRAKQLEILKPRVTKLADSLTPDMLIGPMREIAPMAEIFVSEDKIVSPPPDEDPTILDSLIAVTPVGGVSGPVRGTYGYYLLRVVDRSGPGAKEFARDGGEYAENYREDYRNDLLEKALKKARSFARVEDLRSSTHALLPNRQP